MRLAVHYEDTRQSATLIVDLIDLFSFGILGNALNWIVNYLSDRWQRVAVGEKLSPYTPCTRGVPQGSVLGPLLFSCYISQIRSCLPDIINQELPTI